MSFREIADMCCEAPKETISDREREITSILQECISIMDDFANFVNKSAVSNRTEMDVECFSQNVDKNLELARTLRGQITDLKRVF